MFEAIKKADLRWCLFKVDKHYRAWQGDFGVRTAEKLAWHLSEIEFYGRRALQLSGEQGVEIPDDLEGYITHAIGVNETQARFEVDAHYRVIIEDLGGVNTPGAHERAVASVGELYDHALEAIQIRPASLTPGTPYVGDPKVPKHLATIVNAYWDIKVPLDQTQSLIEDAKNYALKHVATLASKE